MSPLYCSCKYRGAKVSQIEGVYKWRRPTKQIDLCTQNNTDTNTNPQNFT